MPSTDQPRVMVAADGVRVYALDELAAYLPSSPKRQKRKRNRRAEHWKHDYYGVDQLTRVRLRQRKTLPPFYLKIHGLYFRYPGDDRSEIVFQIAKGLADASFPRSQTAEMVQNTVFWLDRESEGKVEDIDNLLDKVYERLSEEDNGNASTESGRNEVDVHSLYALSDDPADWAGEEMPVREWILEDWIPKGKVTALYGTGGAGKTLLMLQLATACVTGRQFVGEPVAPGRVYALLAENEKTDTHLTLHTICRSVGISLEELRGQMRIASRAGEDSHFANYHLGVEYSEFWKKLCAEIESFGPILIILDPVAELFWGNENDRGQVSDFINRFATKLAIETGAAVVILAHPSKSGKATGTSGSTAWNNAVRSRLHLQEPDDPTSDPSYRILTVEKSNFAPRGQSIALVWRDGVFLRETADANHERKEENLHHFIFRVSQAFESGEYLSPHHQAGARYVAKVLAEELRFSEDYMKVLLALAMKREALVEIQVDANTRRKALATPQQAHAFKAKAARSKKRGTI